jgi:4-amino-4-deoxy-L-arabinose transferase-like glycosyltransferase
MSPEGAAPHPAPARPRPRSFPPALGAALLAAALFLPGLGSVGLWDPWEPHYAQVSREMIERADWVHPHWREAWFFSKPALLLWTGAAGLALEGDGPSAEWGLRLPVALLAILGVAFAAAAVERLASRRAAWISALALATAPFVALLARQAIPDLPLAALSAAGGLAFAVALLDDGAGPGWAHAGWVLLGFATLAKGPLGFALPAGALLAWLATTGEWRRAARLRLVEPGGRFPLPLGPLAFLAIAVPWYAVLTAFPGRDDSGWTFLQRFWLHDHLRRFVAGVHVPVPGGGPAAYLGWLAVGTFPWIAAVPGAIGEALRTRGRPGTARDGLLLLCSLWAALGALLVALTATRYPHYLLPLVPPLLVAAALFLDRLLEDGLRAHRLAAALGGVVFAATGWAVAGRPRLLSSLFTYDPRRAWPGDALDAIHPQVQLGPVALSMRPGAVLLALLVAGSLGLAVAALRRSARLAVGGLAGVALLLAAWLSWNHVPELAPHWTQREVFAALAAERPGPDEPVVAWLMNWRGETFYGRGRVREVVDPVRMREVAARPGRLWVVTEPGRIPALRSAVGPGKRLRVAGPEDGRYRLLELTDAPPAERGGPDGAR